MSPAMVDTRPSAAPPPQNPKKGQISAPPSPLQSNPSMDRNEINFGTAGKPTGLSKPRLVKLRRHLASPRVRPSAATTVEPCPGFNPFRAFDSEAGAKFFGSAAKSNENSSGFGSGSSFVFGASSVSNSDSKKSSCLDAPVASKLQDEMRKLNLHAADSQESKQEVGGISENPSRSSSLGVDERVFSELPEEMGKLNLQSGGNAGAFVESEESGYKSKVEGSNAFVFGSSSLHGVEQRLFSELPDEMRKLNLQSGGNKGGSLGGGDKNLPDPSYNLRQNAHLVSDEGSFANLSEEMKKLNLKRFSGEDDPKNTSKTSNGCKFVFGSSSGMNNPPEKSSNLSRDSSVGSGGGKYSMLPDEMKKLNLQNLGNEDGSGHTNRAGHSSNVDGSRSFVFGTSKIAPTSFGSTTINKLPDEMEHLNIGGAAASQSTNAAGLFGFGSNAKSSVSNQTSTSSSTSYDKSAASLPSDVLHKLFNLCKTDADTTNTSYPSMPRSDAESIATNFPNPSTSMHENLDTRHMDFKTLKQDNPSWFKDNFFSTPHQIGMKKGVAKITKPKKKRGKLRQSAPHQQSFADPFTSGETRYQEIPEPEPPCNYSPMDYSPYQDTLVADECSREASVTLDESAHLAFCGVSVEAHREDLVSATQCLETKEGDRKHRDVEDDGKAFTERHFIHESSFVNEKVSHFSDNENVGFNKDTQTTSKEAENGVFSSNIDRQASESGTSFTFTSGLEDFGGSSFSFVAPSSVSGRSSVSKRNYRRKDRVKAGRDMFNSIPDAKDPFASFSFPIAGTCAHQDGTPSLEGTPFVHPSGRDSRSEINNKPDARSESISTEAARTAAQEACEKWRLRGNQAYTNGLLMKAEEYYTRGVNSVSPKETSRCCIQALMLCYSNRAAARMSLGRMREALRDCLMAIAVDPSFLKARLRAGNCHLALGETQDAMKHFMKCLQSGNEENIDKKISSEASEGLQKAQKVANCVDESAKLLRERTSSDTRMALDMISETLSISPQSERLIEMKAEALLLLRSYEEVVELCQRTMDSSERNFDSIGCDGQFKDIDSYEGIKLFPGRLWRWCLISKSYFYLGKLEEALDLLQKHEKVQPVMEKYGSMPPVSSALSSVTVRELLRLKAAGNEAFQDGRHMEAVEHYTSALACNTESRPFTAICFCNRAAAYQTIGQITDAIADCSLAIALDGGYAKAISRRATLHELIRDYGQATNDLHRLVSLLEKQAEATGNTSDLKRARLRLSTVEEEAKRDISLDMYMILGIEPSSSAADIKKAYRKAALKHHPDKACQFLARSENVDDGLWKDIADKVHMDADRLFKMIGEAYTILSDPTKRLQYDAEEEMRTAIRKGYGGVQSPRTPRTSADSYSNPYEKSGNRHQWRDGWKSYGSSQKRWSEYSHSNR